MTKAYAREPIDLSLDVTTKIGASKQDAFDQATEEATRKLAEDLVGAEKIAPRWTQIKTKLLKNTSRYVLFIRASAAVETSGGSQTTVQMRLSPDGLDALLRENGFIGGEGVRVLPLISVIEPGRTRAAWWTDLERTGVAQDYFRRVTSQLNQAARAKSIVMVDPLNPSSRATVPVGYRTETLRHEDQLQLGLIFKADVVLVGRVEVVKGASGSVLNMNCELWQTRNGRLLADGSRSEVLGQDSAKLVTATLDQASARLFGELTAKLSEAAGGGALNLNAVKLIVEGNLIYRQQAEIARTVEGVRDVRRLRERLFEPGRVTFELETGLAASDLARVLGALSVRGFKLTAAENGVDAVVLNVRPVPSGN